MQLIAVTLAWALILPGAPLDDVCIDASSALEEIQTLSWRGQLQEALGHCSHLLACADLTAGERVRTHLQRAKSLDRVGLHQNSRPVLEALAEIEAADALRQQLSPEAGAEIDLAFATYYYRAEMAGRQFESSRSYAEQSLETFEGVDDRAGQASAVHLLGLIHLQRGSEEGLAQARFDESLRLEMSTGDPRGELLADYYRHTAFLSLFRGDLEEALEPLSVSLRLRRESGLLDAAIFAAMTYAETLLDLGRPQDAHDPATRALDEAKRIGSPRATAQAAFILVGIQEALGDFEAASEACLVARAAAASVGLSGLLEAASKRESCRLG